MKSYMSIFVPSSKISKYGRSVSAAVINFYGLSMNWSDTLLILYLSSDSKYQSLLLFPYFGV